MKKYAILVSIIVISIFLRFYQLGINPPSLTWDEVAWGYNAYSIGVDGRDEHGRSLPLDYLESFGDFKPPLYAYLSILPVKIFGLTEFSTRFASAFFGVLTVLLIYFLTKRIFVNPKFDASADGQNSNEKNPKHLKLEISNLTLYLPLIATAIMAISPWHINLSRAAFEANVATFFIVFGVWLFLKSIQEKMWFLPLSVVSFTLSIYVFNTARVVAPILLLLLLLIHIKQILRYKTQLFVGLFLGIILILPILKFLFSPQAGLRFKEVNIFSDIGVINLTNQEIANDNNAWWSRILHNRRFVYVAEYLKHYFDHFKPKFLFISGDGNPKFSTQDVGSLYLWDLPFFILGILFLIRQRIGHWWIVPIWMLIGIIPAATARETPHALRIETTLPTFQILVAYGLAIFFKKISNIPPSLKLWRQGKYFKFFIVVFIFSLLFFNFAYYIHGYYMHYPREYSGEWQYGYKEAIEYIESNEYKYEKIYFTETLGRPYIYVLFYTQYDPKKFRQEAVVEREAFGYVHIRGFEKYRFAKDIKSNAGSSEKVLYVDSPANVPESAQILKNFYLLNGQKTLVAYML